MKLKAACLSALLCMSVSSLAEAGPVVDAAARAEALQAEGKTVEALDALNSAVDEVWNAAPLAFRQVVLVESSDGFGEYVERADRVFRPDDTMMIYVEPVAFGYNTSGPTATIDLDVDVAIENMTGQVLNEGKNLIEFSTETSPRRRELGMTLSLGAPYLRPGDYKAVFTVRDRNTGKSGTFEVPFTLTFPAAAEAPQPGGVGAAAAGGRAASGTVGTTDPGAAQSGTSGAAPQ